MKPFNKRILSALIPAALLAAGSGSALAQGTADYPSKPVVVVVPTEGTGIGEDVRFFIQSIERTYPGTS